MNTTTTDAPVVKKANRLQATKLGKLILTK